MANSSNCACGKFSILDTEQEITNELEVLVHTQSKFVHFIMVDKLTAWTSRMIVLTHPYMVSIDISSVNIHSQGLQLSLSCICYYQYL